MSTSFGDGYAVAIQADGKILATGSDDTTGSGSGSYPRAAIVRLSSSGRLDRGFGRGGIDVIDLGAYSYALAVATAPHGKIVIAGSQAPKLQATDAIVARLTSAGQLDHSFHGSGYFARQYAKAPGAFSAFNAVAVQGNGNVVAAGSATAASRTADAIVARFGGSGGQNGVSYVQSAKQWTETGNVVPGATAVTITDGKIVVAGESVNSVIGSAALWRFTSGGGLDRSFGAGGVTTLKLKSGLDSEATGIAAARSGTVIVGDANEFGGHFAGLVARFH